MSEPVSLQDYESTRDWRRMGRAIRFLTERYTEQPRLEDAADAVGLSPFHFQRLFSRYVGVSPKSFVGHLTLEHAKRELAQGASVLGAALDAGLSGSSRLHDLALKIEAMTPGDYAKGGAGLSIDYGFADCPFGRVLVMTTEKGVCGLAFGDEDEEDAMLLDMTARWPKAAFTKNAVRAEAIAKQIFESEGKTELGLHLLGTPWQIKVWQALLAIPQGKVVTYKTIAMRMGDAKRLARGGHGGGAQSDLLADPLPPRARQRRRAARLPLGTAAQARRCWPWKRHGRKTVRDRVRPPSHRGRAFCPVPISPRRARHWRRWRGLRRHGAARCVRRDRRGSHRDRRPPCHRADDAKPIASSLRAPVWPSRPFTEFSSREISRPSAAARPSRNAVPDGASTL